MSESDSPLYRIHRDTPVHETMLLLALYDAGHLIQVKPRMIVEDSDIAILGLPEGRYAIVRIGD